MPARAGQPKGDAGKHQRKPHNKAALGTVPAPMPVVTAPRPDLAEVEPLFDTYDQPRSGRPEFEGCRFDETAADDAAQWIENNVRHYQGKWAGQPFFLLDWQRRLVRELFGWKQADGTRLYRTCYLEVPRKAGKSTLASAIALLLGYGDGEAAPQIYFAAYDKDQAAVCYQSARHMIEASPYLAAQTVIYNSRKEMLLLRNPGGTLKCLSSEASKQYGLNLHGLIFDELFTQKNRVMWDALTTSQGSREQPLTFAISTAGWDQNGVCFEQHEHARQISEGTTIDPHFLGVVYGAAQDADWTEQDVWQRANPSLGHTVKIDYYQEKFTAAKAMPSAENAFRVLLLSQWVGQADRVIPMEAWDRCAFEPAATGPAYGGLDLSSTTDLTAFVLAFGTPDGFVDLIPHFFIPADNLRERSLRDRVNYDVWIRDGLVTATPGAVVDYGIVKATIVAAQQKYDLRTVGFDRWGATHLAQELEDEGVKMEQVGQGFASMSAPTKELLRLVMAGRLRHGGNPVLRWNADNAAANTDPAGNLKPAKDRSAGRIDGIVASIMAIDGWMRGQGAPKRSFYDDNGLEAI